MIRAALVDIGPLIALLDQRDQHHSWVQAKFAEILPPLLTCEAVLTEACYLTRRVHGGVQGVLDLFERAVVRLAFDLPEHFLQVTALMKRYGNVPMSLADACLVRMAELVKGSVVFTLDHDFRIYRRHQNKSIPLLMPPHA